MPRSCSSCSKSLASSLYYSKRRRFFCPECYEVRFCKTCRKCNQKIKVVEQGITWCNAPWHGNCFNCTQCNISLSQRTQLYEKNHHPYCSNCYNVLFSPECDKCGEMIEGSYSVINGQTIHSRCFTCFSCGSLIKGHYRTENGLNYHPYCLDNSHNRGNLLQDRNRKDRHPFRNTQRTDHYSLTTITALDLKASGVQNSRPYHPTTAVQKLDHILVKSTVVQTEENSHAKIPFHPISQTKQRARTAAPRRFPILIETVQTDQAAEYVAQKTRLQNSLRRNLALPAIADGKVQDEKNYSTQVFPTPVPRQTRTCQVCYEDKVLTFYAQPISSQCEHRKRTICNKCIYRHVANAFEEMCRDDVRCPEIDRPMILDYDAIKRILTNANDTALFKRFDWF